MPTNNNGGGKVENTIRKFFRVEHLYDCGTCIIPECNTSIAGNHAATFESFIQKSMLNGRSKKPLKESYQEKK